MACPASLSLCDSAIMHRKHNVSQPANTASFYVSKSLFVSQNFHKTLFSANPLARRLRISKYGNQI